MNIGAWDSDSGDVFVIAECGVNHGGSVDTAYRLIEAAKQAGADAVKFQWFKTDALVQRRGPQAEALRPLELSEGAMRALAGRCVDLDLPFLCSVFDLESADAYLALDPVAVKIGSGELTDEKLLHHVSAAHIPMIISTGMATMREIGIAVKLVRWETRYALLHCVSAYPTPLDQVNLRALDALRAFHCPVGFSDHGMWTWTPALAVARGAVIIEKHITLDRTLPGPDHMSSATPEQFAEAVWWIRQTTAALGSGEKIPQPCEAATMKACGR